MSIPTLSVASGGLVSLESLAFVAALLGKGLVVLAAVALVLRLVAARGAALRHAAWTAAFVALLALPFASALVPAWSVPGSSQSLGGFAEQITAWSQQAQARGEHLAARAAQHLGGTETTETAAAPAVTPTALEAPPAPPSPPDAAPLPLAPAAAEPVAPMESATRAAPPWLLRLVLGVWIVGVLLLLGRLATSVLAVRRLIAKAKPLTGADWLADERAVRAELGLRRTVALWYTDAVEVPLTVGVRRPLVLLPGDAEAWSAERRRIVLLHEMAHVGRGDYAWHLLVMTARALHWPNPLAWWAAARHVMEREHACDDRVLRAGITPTRYADELVSVARDLFHRPALAGAFLPMARPSELRARVRSILAHAPTPTPSRLHLAGVVALTGILLLPLAAFRFDQAAPMAPTPVASAPSLAKQSEPLPETASEAPLATAQAPPAPTPVPEPPPVPFDVPDVAEVSESSEAPPAPPTLPDSALDVRLAAVQALGQLSSERAVPLLSEIAQTGPHPELREAAVFWLSQKKDASVLPLLDRVARTDADEDVREKAVFAIGEVGGEAALAMLTRFAQDASLGAASRGRAVFWLGERGGAQVLPILDRLARTDPHEDVRERAIFAIAQIDGAASQRTLTALATDTNLGTETRERAVFWLGDRVGIDAIDVLQTLALNDADADVRERAVFAISQIGGARAFDVLASIARDPSAKAKARERAIFWLGESGDPRAADVLVELLRSGD